MGLSPERTYAAVAVVRKDGKAMQEEDSNLIFVSPLIEGLNPVQYNIASMNGSRSWMEKDGILYIIVDCDDITCFADRKIYLAVQSGAFYDNQAYVFDEGTGSIQRNESYQEMNLLFELPADKKLADPKKAEQYLKKLEQQWSIEAEVPELPDVNEVVKTARLIEDSVKEVVRDKDGNYYYEYLFGYVDGLEDITNYSSCMPMFEEDQYGYFLGSMAEKDDSVTYVVFHKDKDGKITGMVYVE